MWHKLGNQFVWDAGTILKHSCAHVCMLVHVHNCKPVEMHDFIRVIHSIAHVCVPNTNEFHSIPCAHIMIICAHGIECPCCWGTVNLIVHATCIYRAHQALQRGLENTVIQSDRQDCFSWCLIKYTSCHRIIALIIPQYIHASILHIQA